MMNLMIYSHFWEWLVCMKHTQKRINEAVLVTVTHIAERAGVGETSVIRFCRALGLNVEIQHDSQIIA